ncbi:alpha/beta hydrolase [Alteribacter lacisalsi]|uniref:Alpha/beta hydrolase n=1 Tax=Alteribacter lacisalsi TaxID=2045244 RepID=A0A2W0H2B3_9BACI|nr:alpha/beta hydrolase [Alteribacter lacisalsi]PYZ95924.1 alpha/beta hydrolase [Alteribacter lacisalsi]
MRMTVNGNELYYEIHGNPEGETIFFIHGAPGIGDCRGDIQSFSPLGDEYRLVFMDMRGSGRSEGKPPFTHEQWTADIEAMRKELVNGPIRILGGSYGGFLTLEYVLRYPQNVTHVMLRDTAASSEFNQLSIDRALNSDLANISEDDIYRLFEGKVHSDEELKRMFGAILPLYTVEYDEEKAKERLENIYFRHETHNYAFRYNKPEYDLTGRLKEIQVPVLVTVGRHDWVTPVVCSDKIAANVQDATYVIFENSGHSPQVEENEKYLSLVRDFLKVRSGDGSRVTK